MAHITEVTGLINLLIFYLIIWGFGPFNPKTTCFLI